MTAHWLGTRMLFKLYHLQPLTFYSVIHGPSPIVVEEY